MTIIARLSLCPVLLLAWVLLTPQSGRADQIINVNVNTSSLAGGATYYLNFQLTNGDATRNNSVTVTHFNFGGGAAGGASTIQTTGGVSGSLNSGAVTLTDTAFFNNFLQAFTPGGTLALRATIIAPSFAGGTPDLFTFAILDSSLVEVATTDPTGLNQLLAVTIDSSNPSSQQFQLAPAAIPEPTTLLLFGTGLTAIAGAARRRRSDHRS